MNNTINEAIDSVPTPARKNGIVADFRICSDNYLSLISEDLGLGATADQMKILQNAFKSLNRDPSVSELYFSYAALLRSQKNAAEEIGMSHAENCTDAMTELLEAFIRRYLRACGTEVEYPPLVKLAEFAATGKMTQDLCGICVCETNELMSPDVYSGRLERVTAGEFTVAFSGGKHISGNTSGDVCVLISPKPGDDIDTFIKNVQDICKRYLSEYPQTKIFPASARSLLDDLFDVPEGWLIDTSLYPMPSQFAESVFLTFNPSMILLPSRTNLQRLWEIAFEYGITPHAPAATRAKTISVKASGGSVEFDKSFFELIKPASAFPIRHIDNAYIEDVGDVAINESFSEYILSVSPHTLTARKVGGCNLYEDLSDAMKDTEATYAIIGTIDPQDGCFLSSVLTIDSFRRNNSPRIVYSRFFISNHSTITVLKLKCEK
ncbi:MAG: hypothetical protein IJD70_05805 [Clostridia bacterium]|nr:hypothetical protein [Clostridia bacterium]